MNQSELWSQVNTIKRSVRLAIGTDLSHEFRSTSEYMNYCGLSGEAQLANEDECLDQEIVIMLKEYANKVIKLWQTNPENQQT